MTKEEKKERHGDAARKYRIANPDASRIATKKWRENNREKYLESQRKSTQKKRTENPEYNRVHCKMQYEKNREKRLSQCKEYRNAKLNNCVYCLELSDHRIYVGSTNYLSRRISIHKRECNEFHDRLLYKAIIECGGWDIVRVHILMKDIPDYDLRLKLEQHFIDMVPDELSLNVLNAVQKAS